MSRGPLGTPRLHLRATDSTNARARDLAGAGAPHGTLVTASEQSAGRGRQGRTWAAPAGAGLLMSLVLRPPSRLTSLGAGVAVAETAEAFGADEVQIKWPNDVWIGGRKVAGILVEGRPQEGWAVLGIGLNVRPQVFPAELADRATTLGLEAASGPGLPTVSPAVANDPVEAVLAALLDRLDIWLEASDDRVLSAIRARDALLGREIAWAEGSGVAAGLDAAGRLLVDTVAAGRVALDAGEVHLRLSA